MIETAKLLEFIERFTLDESKYYPIKSLYNSDTYDIFLQRKLRRNETAKWIITKRTDNRVALPEKGIHLTVSQLIVFIHSHNLDLASLHKLAYGNLVSLIGYTSMVQEGAEQLEEGVVQKSKDSLAAFKTSLLNALSSVTKKPKLTPIDGGK